MMCFGVTTGEIFEGTISDMNENEQEEVYA
jgi:hypothetical protein